MAKPHITDAHLRIAHSIGEAIMLRDFSKRQRKILDLILRLSWGCGKKTAVIPRQKDFQTVGIGEGHIQTELVWLVESKVITRDGTVYSFNKDFDQWQVSRVRPFEPHKLTELVRYNLNGAFPDKTSVKNELTKTGSLGLPKQEVRASRISKSTTPEPASSKEIVKEKVKKGSIGTGITSDEIVEIAELYEGEIGKITQVVAEALHEAVEEYPADWIKDAIKEATKNNVRKWRYIEAILERWKEEGHNGEKGGAEKYGRQGSFTNPRERAKSLAQRSDEDILGCVKYLRDLTLEHLESNPETAERAKRLRERIKAGK